MSNWISKEKVCVGATPIGNLQSAIKSNSFFFDWCPPDLPLARGKLWALSKASLHGKDKQHLLQMPPLIKRSLAWLMSIRLVHAVLLSTIPCIRPPSHLITQGMQSSNQKTKKMPGNTWDLISHLLSLLTTKIYIFSSKLVGFVTNSPPRAVVQRCSFFAILLLVFKSYLDNMFKVEQTTKLLLFVCCTLNLKKSSV